MHSFIWLGLQTVSSLEKCSVFRMSFIQTFHCCLLTIYTGDLVQVFVEKKVPTIHARVEGAEPASLSIPVACMELTVALLPPNDREAAIVNRSWERTFTSVSEILASRTLPPVREDGPLNQFELSMVT